MIYPEMYANYNTGRNEPVNAGEKTEVFILEPPYLEPRQIHEFDPRIVGGYNDLSWSHAGDKIAFIKIMSDQLVVSVLNIETMREKLFYTGINEAVITPLYWSADDTRLAFSVMLMDYDYRIKTIYLNLTTSVVSHSPNWKEFVAWSRHRPDEYLYIQHHYTKEPNYPYTVLRDERVVSIGKIGVDAPLVTISDLGEYTPRRSFHLSWSPDETFAIAAVYEAPGIRTIKINFFDESWISLEYTARDGRPDMWSPDGQWMVFWQEYESYHLWAVEHEETPTVLLPLQERVHPLGWTSDSQFLFVRDGDDLFALGAAQNFQERIPLLSLSDFGIPHGPYASISVWMPP